MCLLLQEVAEPLMDLKKGMDELHTNKTFKYILSAILTVGNFLNGAQVGMLARQVAIHFRLVATHSRLAKVDACYDINSCTAAVA